MKIRRENEAILEALKTVTCPPCGGPRPGKAERELSVQTLRLQNAYLKDQVRVHAYVFPEKKQFFFDEYFNCYHSFSR